MANWVNRAANHPATKPTAIGTALCIAASCVAGYEGFFSKKYLDVVGVPTVCYGATAADGVDLTKTYTKAECQAMLVKDLEKYDAQVKKCITVPMPPHREAAIISFTYNVGWGALCKSSVARDMNAGRTKEACDDLLKFNRAGGRVIKGLTTRRQSERVMCLRED